MWHEATKVLQDAGDIQLVGIVQEQHGDRARLFMQWKQMDWPLMVDAQNLLGVAVVPIVVLIDEHGIVRHLPRRASAPSVEAFLAESFEAPEAIPWLPIAPPLGTLKLAASNDDSAEAWRQYGQAIVEWGDPDELETSVDAFTRAIERDPDDGPTHFRLGVAYRKRYDSPARQSGDFQNAVDQWGKAIELNPNQYIWRRRVQQYGPRLVKPYPFYDWVVEARADIEDRGDAPAVLVAEPSGAEIAMPMRAFASADGDATEPDAQGRIHRDERGFIDIETTVVPSSVRPGRTARVHLVFRPNVSIKAHWNNEAEAMSLWVAPPEGCDVDAYSRSVPNPPTAVSTEPRRFEFELQVPKDAQPGRLTLPAYALYNVCEGENGTCLYRRQDVEIEIEVRAP